MCTETFLRLPEEKRKRFLDAAWEEFTRVNFSEASINQIVRRAGIPRGSFYQYFSDKDDLFDYLLNAVRSNFVESYRNVITVAMGDVFQAQVDCYDRFFQQREAGEGDLDRCIKVVQMNPGMDIQKMMRVPDQPENILLKDIWDRMDMSGFRRQDREYVQSVFALTLMVLGAAIMERMVHPDWSEKIRQELQVRLDIIKDGSLAEPRRENA